MQAAGSTSWLVVLGLGLLFWLRHRFGQALERRRQERILLKYPGLAQDVRRLTRVAFALIPTTSETFSKLGGRPDLPSGRSWPLGADGPLQFVVQIARDELPLRDAPDWFGVETLYVFLDRGLIGEPTAIKLVTGRGSPTAQPRPANPSRNERRVCLSAFESAPSPEWLGVDGTVELELNLRIRPAPPSGTGRHHLFGYPEELQHMHMSLECARLACELESHSADWGDATGGRPDDDWRLLLQLDSDEKLKMDFGDGGRLFVFVRPQDARRGNFDRTITLWQPA